MIFLSREERRSPRLLNNARAFSILAAQLLFVLHFSSLGREGDEIKSKGKTMAFASKDARRRNNRSKSNLWRAAGGKGQFCLLFCFRNLPTAEFFHFQSFFIKRKNKLCPDEILSPRILLSYASLGSDWANGDDAFGDQDATLIAPCR